MRFGPLYEQAVDLTPRAATIAATLLVREVTLPEPLRRALAITLSACGKCAHGHDNGSATSPGTEGRDCEVRTAMRFVEACKALCARG
jgi:hypothetical protein